jgi:hypothetical protein
MIVSVTFGAKYLTGMVTGVPPYATFSLIKNNILHTYNNVDKCGKLFPFFAFLRSKVSILLSSNILINTDLSSHG